MSGYKGICGSVEGSTDAQAAWDACEISTEIPYQLETNVHLWAEPVNECS